MRNIKAKKVVSLLLITIIIVSNSFSSLGTTKSETNSSGTGGNETGNKAKDVYRMPLYTIRVVDDDTGQAFPAAGAIAVEPEAQAGNLAWGIPVPGLPDGGFQMAKKNMGIAENANPTFKAWAVATEGGHLSSSLLSMIDKLGICSEPGISANIPSNLTYTADDGTSTTYHPFEAWLVGLKEMEGKTVLTYTKRYLVITNWQKVNNSWNSSPEITTSPLDGYTNDLTKDPNAELFYAVAKRHANKKNLNTGTLNGLVFVTNSQANVGVVAGGSFSSYSASSNSNPTPTPTPTPIPTPDQPDKFDKMILFEDELSYVYNLFQANADTSLTDSQQTTATAGNKQITIKGELTTPHHGQDTCGLGSTLSGCSKMLNLATTVLVMVKIGVY